MSEAEATIAPSVDATAAFRPGVAFAILTALGCGLAMTWPQATDVWTTGAFGDTDDAMRMVQVREFIASGRWFDTTIPRLGGTEGMLSH